MKAAGGDWDDQSNPWVRSGKWRARGVSRRLDGTGGEEGYLHRCRRVVWSGSSGALCTVPYGYRGDVVVYGERGTDEEGGQVCFGLTRASACVVRYHPW